MGTRHQIYIIASVRDFYRVVAVFHRQALYPPEAVQLAWTLLQLIKKYAEPLEKELRCVEHHIAGEDAEFPCPYLTSLPFENIEDFSKYACPETVIDNEPLHQDNNSGFTFIDITESFAPRYCFCGVDSSGGFSPGDLIDPENYALRYYVYPGEEQRLEELDQKVQDAIRALQYERFIDSKDLVDDLGSPKQ